MKQPIYVLSDPFAYVKKIETRVFKAGQFNPEEMVALIVTEALLCRSHRMIVHREGEWYAIYSQQEWLTESDPLKSFTSIVNYAIEGMRVEVIAYTFAEAILTASPNGFFVLKGTYANEMPDLVDQALIAGRLVAFRV